MNHSYDINVNTKSRLARVAALLGALAAPSIADTIGYSGNPLGVMCIGGVTTWGAAHFSKQEGFAAIPLSGLVLLKTCDRADSSRTSSIGTNAPLIPAPSAIPYLSR